MKTTTPDDTCFLLEVLNKHVIEPGPQSDDETFRRALFARMEVKPGKKMPALDVFFDSLTTASARGDVHANRALKRISEHRTQTEKSTRAAVEADARLGGPRRRRIQEVANLLGGLIYLMLLPSVQESCAKRYGSLKSLGAPDLYYLDPAPAAWTLVKFEQRRRRKRGKSDYEVGYRKPPAAGRFTSENNPAQKRKGQTPPPWAGLDRSLTKPAFKTKLDGKRVKSTAAAISYDQLILKAIKGDQAARAEVVQRIIELDQKGKLSAVAPVRRARRKPPHPDLEAKIEKAIALITPKIRHDMIANIERRYGKPSAVEDYETAQQAMHVSGDEDEGKYVNASRTSSYAFAKRNLRRPPG